ncbi:uncharacterized protein LOC113790384 [Dermatophagoides pteronyssinus]|uniref:uncharacterized protein LOC113790384 n=1 Tax=Dermatophagoides pteronyssinus TaxID=6956 RepID=UPI003F6620A0
MRISTSMNLSQTTMTNSLESHHNDNDDDGTKLSSSSAQTGAKTDSTTTTAKQRIRALRSFSSCPSSTTNASTMTTSTNLLSTSPTTRIKSTSFDQENFQQPNELIIMDYNQTITAIDVPPNTLHLYPFRPASELHPEPGDIIEFDRTLFSQWGIYVGDGNVVVIVGGNGNSIQMVPDVEIAHVELVPLNIVAGDHYCRVNNKFHRAKERNLLPFNNEIVVRKALSKVGTTVPYNALQCNTEHYVTEWKYGQRWSDQAQVSLHSFKALRLQHTNSISESHNVFVNALNEVLNSPAISTTPTTTTSSSHGSNQNTGSGNNSQLASPTTNLSSNSKPIQINNTTNIDQMDNRNRSTLISESLTSSSSNYGSGGCSGGGGCGDCDDESSSSNSSPLSINLLGNNNNLNHNHHLQSTLTPTTPTKTVNHLTEFSFF